MSTAEKMPKDATTMQARLIALCSDFKLPTLATELVPCLQKAGQSEALPLVLEVFELEAQDRLERRIDRLRRASRLPPGKTMATLDQARLPRSLVDKLRVLARGEFLTDAQNVLAFGLPGTGKSHAASAIGHALVEAGHSVLFVPTYQLVQELLVAKRDLDLPRALRKLDLFELIILDDIGYVGQSPDEAEVLFTLMAERYERRSMLITSNLVFSQWDRIFKNPMATAAAIDRLVHHAVILEFDVSSYRTEDAKKRSAAKAADNYPKSNDNYPKPDDNYPTKRPEGPA
jgi:DNA replication protein DnaC